ncbi:MAG TPA: efflux RND transporter periplasmic adaptor subunit [Terriglobia bacterium]|nr:efflux RND transporter periplasmic adaptor subunit [Terriglobia bacterium]
MDQGQCESAVKNCDRPGTARVGLAIALLALASAGCNSGGQGLRAAPTRTAASLPAVETVSVVSRSLSTKAQLPGEILPYEVVGIFPKVTGFVKWMGVDRGSHVANGQLLAMLDAPELVSQKFAAQANLQSAESRVNEAQAKLIADKATYARLQTAARTPGVISEDELETAEKNADADLARVNALRNTVEADKATLNSIQQMEGYLRITAPFEGIITERSVHPGALVGPAGGPNQVPMLRLEQLVHLRLVIDVPEAYVAGVREGTKVKFTVPSFPDREFAGSVARIANSLEAKTRTMPVELDVANPDRTLAPGMFPTVSLPVERPGPTLQVPISAVARTMESEFVVRVRDGRTEWVSVKTGLQSGNLIEVFGGLREGDEVALRGSDELPPNSAVVAKAVPLPN